MKIISLSSFRVNFYLFHFVDYITKNDLNFGDSQKYNFDEVKI